MKTGSLSLALLLLWIGLLPGCSNTKGSLLETRAVPVHRATKPVPNTKPEWIARFTEFQALARRGRGKQLVFLGDSITQGWESEGKDVWASYYSRREAVNFGINGDFTEHVLWRLLNGNLKGMNPKLLILLIGVNNAHARQPAQEIADGIRAIVETLQEQLPQTEILLLGIFPSGREPTHPRRVISSRVNVLLRTLADDHRVRFLDIGQVFLAGDGTISEQIMPDYLHLSAQGYALWAEALEPTVRALLGESR